MFEIHKLTGALLVAADGTPQGPESAGVVSTHATEAEAARELRNLQRLGNGINAGRYQVRDAGGAVVDTSDYYPH